MIVILALAVVQVAVVASDQLAVHHAARAAARSAAVEPDEAAALDAARAAAPGLDRDRLSVTLSGGREAGDRLTAEVRYRPGGVVPLVGAALGSIELRAAVTMRVE